MKVLKWVGLGFVGIVIVAAIAGGGSDKKSEDKSSAARTVTVTQTVEHDAAKTPVAKAPAVPPPPPPPSAPATCGTQATEDCTPHVGTTGHVRVDALTWRIRSARVAKTLGDPELLGARANGQFVIVNLRVHSYKDESATLSDNVIHLEVNGNTYDADSDGTIAAIGSGQEPFFLDTIGPDSDRDGTVVFDVPAKVLARKLEVRFNELGFGSTKGYIRLKV